MLKTLREKLTLIDSRVKLKKKIKHLTKKKPKIKRKRIKHETKKK
jgi:hypothetical protein